jgi:hypothetical protein
MRRTLFFALGVLEILVAAVLLVLAWQLPGAAEVEDKVGRVEKVSRETAGQVRGLRDQFRLLRRRQPEAQELAQNLRVQMKRLYDSLKSQEVNYDAAHSIRDSLGEVARGIDGLSDALDSEALDQLAAGLSAAADFLDLQVAPAAERTAERLESSARALRAELQGLGGWLRGLPLDLNAAHTVRISLDRLDQALAGLGLGLEPEHVEALRDRYRDLQAALSRAAAQVEAVSAATFPAVSFQGGFPSVEVRPLWPEGRQAAAVLGRVADNAAALGKEVDALNRDLPHLRGALQEGRLVAERSRRVLTLALEQQQRLLPLLGGVPDAAARLADELPAAAADLARALGDTARLRGVAAGLRRARASVLAAAGRWPEVRRNLLRSAALLRATQAELGRVIDRQGEYSSALQRSLSLINSFMAALPLFTAHLGHELQDQEESLQRLEQGLNEVTAVLPQMADGATRIFRLTRLLMLLVAAVFGLHGGYLAIGSRLDRHFAP